MPLRTLNCAIDFLARVTTGFCPVIFPEIDYLKVDKARGMNISFVTTAKTNEEARRLLQLMGMPFRQN